ncbi:MAG: PmoA family protein [Bacteroidota bacterium]
MRFWSFILSLFIGYSAFAQIQSLEVEAGEHNRAETPIYFKVEGNKSYQALLNLETQDTVFLAPSSTNPNTYFFILDQDLNKGISKKYQLLSIENQEITTYKFQSWRYGKSLKLKQQDHLTVAYNFGLRYPIFEAPEYYKRSGFFHPVYTPDGVVLSDDFPIGHAHQNGIFNTWVNTTFQGKKVDFWNRQKQLGKVSSQNQTKGITLFQHKNGSQSFHDTLLHIAIDTSIKKEQIVLKEVQHLTLYPTSDYHLFDIYSKQINVSSDTLFINKYHYGGMAFRGSKFWNEADTLHFEADMKIVTSEGKNRAASNHTRPNWICAYGTIEGKEVGIAVFNHPSNFRSPQFVRVHPKMPYFCFTPTVEEGFPIAPQGSYEAQFRLVTFDGAPDLKLLERLWLDYAFSAKIKIF